MGWQPTAEIAEYESSRQGPRVVLLLAWAMVAVISIATDRWPSAELRFAPLLLGGLAVVASGNSARWVRSVASALLVGLTVTVALLVAVPTEVGSGADLRSVAFGWPSPWLVQDLSQLDPPEFPQSIRPSAHAELGTPVEVRWLAFGGIVVGAAVVGGSLTGLARRTRVTRFSSVAHGARGGTAGDGAVT